MTMKWHYRVTITSPHFDHLPTAVSPCTDWIEAPSLRQAKRAVLAVVHILAQSHGRTRDTGGTWRIEGPTRDVWRFDLFYSHDAPITIIGEIARAPHYIRRVPS